jgi:hypothetical protein
MKALDLLILLHINLFATLFCLIYCVSICLSRLTSNDFDYSLAREFILFSKGNKLP